MQTDERELNQAAYRRLKDSIKQTYPHGQFVAIHGEKIVGDASQFFVLYESLKKAGLNPPDVLIVQAGQEFPDKVIIF